MITWTARPKEFSGYVQAPYSYAEIISPESQQKRIGLCTNERCVEGSSSIINCNNKTHYRRFYTYDKKLSDCPLCSYALFWSRSYRFMWPEEYEHFVLRRKKGKYTHPSTKEREDASN